MIEINRVHGNDLCICSSVGEVEIKFAIWSPLSIDETGKYSYNIHSRHILNIVLCQNCYQQLIAGIEKLKADDIARISSHRIDFWEKENDNR